MSVVRRDRDCMTLSWVLGGSWVVISGVIGGVTIGITHIRGSRTPLIPTHELPSRFPTQSLQLPNPLINEHTVNVLGPVLLVYKF